jgi:hypothetical protein
MKRRTTIKINYKTELIWDFGMNEIEIINFKGIDNLKKFHMKSIANYYVHNNDTNGICGTNHKETLLVGKLIEKPIILWNILNDKEQKLIKDTFSFKVD